MVYVDNCDFITLNSANLFGIISAYSKRYTMADKVIKNNIKEIRKKKGLTQQQLADKIGISQVHLGRLETNARSMDLEQVEKIANALGVKPFEILPQEWQPEDISPEEREILRMIRKTSSSQEADYRDIPASESISTHTHQPPQSPQKSNSR